MLKECVMYRVVTVQIHHPSFDLISQCYKVRTSDVQED